jgi:hypothetical protein
MNLLLSEEWLSELDLDQPDRWLTLATIASSGAPIDMADLAEDPAFAPLAGLGLPIVDKQKVENEWRSQGRPMDSQPNSGDWTMLFDLGNGDALLVPQEAAPEPRLMLFTPPDALDGLRLALIYLEDHVVTWVRVHRRGCRRDRDTGICSGKCRRNGTCDWRYYAGDGPVTGKCERMR